MCLLLACFLAMGNLLALPDGLLAADAPPLAAGEALILNPPRINDSIGNPVHCLAFVDGGASVALGATSAVLVWDTATGKLRHTLELDDRSVDSLAVDAGESRLVAGGATGLIKVFDARTFKLIHTLGPASGAVRGLAISPDGKLLASAGPDGQAGEEEGPFEILLWDLATGKLVRKIPHARPAFGTTVLAFLADGTQLVTAQDRTFRLFDVHKGEELRTIDQPDLPRSLGSLALRGDGQRLATGVFEPKVRIWNTQTWTQELAWDAHEQQPPPREGVSTVNYSPDGRYVLTGGMDGMASVWDAATGRRLLELDARGESSGRWITGVAMTANNGLLAASHYGGTATLWRITAAK